MNKTKLIWVGIVVLALIFAGFLWYQSYGKKGNNLQGTSGTEMSSDEAESMAGSFDSEDLSDGIMSEEDDTDYNAICENGEWVDITAQSGTLSSATGKLRKVYPDDESTQFKNYLYYIEGTESLGITGDSLYKLDYFEDREVEVQGVKNGSKNETAIAKLKCTGSETDKDLIGNRNKLMSWLASNINSIAPQKAKYEKWTVDIVDFIDAGNVYVEYYDTVEDNEDSDVDDDTSRRILIETSPKSDGSYSVNVLAYWEMGEDDYVIKTGTDKFEDEEEIASYQYDPEDGTWERID